MSAWENYYPFHNLTFHKVVTQWISHLLTDENLGLASPLKHLIWCCYLCIFLGDGNLCYHYEPKSDRKSQYFFVTSLFCSRKKPGLNINADRYSYTFKRLGVIKGILVPDSMVHPTQNLFMPLKSEYLEHSLHGSNLSSCDFMSLDSN